MNSLLIAVLFLGALGAVVWLAFTRGDPDEKQAVNRRTAEDRLRAQQCRNVKRLTRRDDEKP